LERIKEIQKKYGITMCLDVFPSIVKKIQEKPQIVLNIANKGAIRVNLMTKPVEDWIEKFKLPGQ